MGEGSPDIVIVGSGIGGATVAAGLARAGLGALVLERGEQLAACAEARDPVAIFQRGHFRSPESWLDGTGAPFNPGNYYYVGGNSKFYGAVMLRYRERDFEEMEHAGGLSPAWPFRYAELALWYDDAEALYRVHGASGGDPTEPPRNGPYPFPPVPDERAMTRLSERLRAAGAHPFPLPLAVEIDTWLAGGWTPWDAFPDTRSGKNDAETTALAEALASGRVSLETGARVLRLETEPDGRRVNAVVFEKNGEERRITPKLVILAAGAVQSAAILLASGLANRSDQVGRNFMNHNSSAVIAVDPRFVNDSVYQKTLAINDFYFSDGAGGPPLGNIQMLGRVSGAILKANVRWAPQRALDWMSRHGADFYAMSEDLPDPESRVTLDGGRIRLHWRRSNMEAQHGLVKRLTRLLKDAGFPIVRAHLFDRRTPSHQCGTVRIGDDPASAPLDPYGRAFDHPNLFVADASCLPTSAAVNPALTIAALALRAADHIAKSEFA